MSINYCTIGRDRIDGFCGNQRAKVLARLIHEAGHDIVVPPTPTPIPRHSGGITFNTGLNFKPNVQPHIDRNLPPVEQPYITVHAEIFGMSGSETVETIARLDFVVITNLEINEENKDVEINVNISQMEI